jgi:hypothetical protein
LVDGKEKLYQLSYDTRVLLARNLPALEDIDILPYSGNYRRRLVLPGHLSKHYEVRWVKDLTRTSWTHLASFRSRRYLGSGSAEEPDPNRGKVLTRVSPVKLLGLPVGTPVLFRLGEAWERGEIETYVNQTEVKKTQEKARKKIKIKLQRYLRLPTIWDRLSD